MEGLGWGCLDTVSVYPKGSLVLVYDRPDVCLFSARTHLAAPVLRRVDRRTEKRSGGWGEVRNSKYNKGQYVRFPGHRMRKVVHYLL